MGLITDRRVRLKLGRPTDDIKKFLKSVSDERKECVCQRKLRRAISLIEANIPQDLWKSDLKRQVIEDHMVVDLTLKRKVSIRLTVEKYLKDLEEARKKGIGFVFIGPNGTGKTFFGCRMLIRAIKKGFSCHYVFFYDLIEMLKEFDDDFVYSVIDEIYDVDFLFIDEVGKEFKTSQFVLTNFEKMLKQRRSKSKPTIFASNKGLDELRSQYGSSVKSLMESKNLILSFEGITDKRIRDGVPQLRKFFEVS